MKLAADTTLAEGRYQLKRRLGAGGMASVWLASDSVLDRPVAIKLIADTLAADPEWRERFEREALAAASVTHHNVVRVFDYGFEDDRPWLVMEYVEGGSLAELIARGNTATIDLVPATRGLLSALEAVHAVGLVHRDVKPGNVLLDGYGEVRLTDFGVARRPDDTTGATQTGMVLGTARYVAPEVWAGAPASERSDLYSAGRVIAELAGDSPPGWASRLVEQLTAADPLARRASAEDALAVIPSPSREPPASAPTATVSLNATTLPLRPPNGLARAQSSVRGRARAAGIGPRAIGAMIAAVVMVGALIALFAAGAAAPPHTGGGSRTTVPLPAARSAPLGDQLNAITRIVDHAAGH
jgi:serine/threonine-protein kinase